MKKYFHIFALLLTGVILVGAPKPSQKALTIGMMDLSPYSFRNSKGEITGLIIDGLALWSKKTSVKVKFVLLEPRNMVKALATGKIDLVLTPKDSLPDKKLQYSDLLWKAEITRFCKLPADRCEANNNLVTCTVGIIRNGLSKTRIKSWLPRAKIIEYNNGIEMARELKNGKLASFILPRYGGGNLIDRVVGQTDVKLHPLAEVNFYLAAIKKNTTLIKNFNLGWRLISQKEKDMVIRNWRGEIASQPVKPKEFKRTLKVAICTEMPPFEYADAYGNMRGFVPNFWREWAMLTGIPVEFIRCKKWSETIKLVENGEADVHSGLFKNINPDNNLIFCDKSYHVSKLFFYFDSNLFGLKSISDLTGFDVGVVEDSFSENFFQYKYPHITLKRFENANKMIEAAIAGKIRVFASEAEIAKFIMQKPYIRNRFRYHPDRPLAVCQLFPAVRKGNEALRDMIQSGISSFSQDQAVAKLSSVNNLVIALPPTGAPYVVTSPDGSLTGLGPALFRAWAAKAKVAIELKTADSWDELYKMLKDEKIDLFAMPADLYDFTSFKMMPSNIIVKYCVYYNNYGIDKVTDFRDLQNLLIGVAVPQLPELRRKYPSLHFVPYQNRNQMLLDYSQNRIKGFVVPAAGMRGVLTNYGLSEFTSRIAKPIIEHCVYLTARRRDHKTINLYMDQMQKNELDSSELRRIYDNWVVSEGYDWPKILVWCGIILLCILILVIWLFFLWREVKRRRMAELLLVEQNELLETVKSVAGVGGFEYDFAQDQMFWTNALYNVLEAPEDYEPKYEDLKRFDSFLVMDQKVKRAARERDTSFCLVREDVFTSFEGRRRWAKIIVILRERRVTGQMILIGVINDITALKEAEQMREDVDRIMRHDLKGPLSGIIGIPEALLEDENLNDEQRELLSYIHDSGAKMLRMINESLVLYKIETGTFQLAPESVNICEVIDQVVISLGSISESNNSSIETRFTEELVILGNPLLCYSAFTNLIKNALEAAPENSNILVTGVMGKNRVTVAVSNPGSVPDEIKQCFFDKYTTSGKKSGTGLGTYSARILIEAQNGDVSLDTSLPGSVTVIVELPAVVEAE
jgi:signal transduction histidine kinase/ABC-type amino acid transport substrate-binding protein